MPVLPVLGCHGCDESVRWLYRTRVALALILLSTVSWASNNNNNTLPQQLDLMAVRRRSPFFSLLYATMDIRAEAANQCLHATLEGCGHHWPESLQRASLHGVQTL